MEATQIKLLDFLRKSPQFITPIYQRTYSWTESQCRQLWEDILRAGSNDTIPAHFVGSIVYIHEGYFQVASQSQLLVIDGQQRLTTVSLIIEALARHLGDSEPLDGFSDNKLRHYYLLNSLESDERRYKLLLTQTDKHSLLSLVDRKQLPAEYSLRVKENFEYFEKKVKTLGDNLIPLCRGLVKLMVVDISLRRDQDNPQLIFESMNSTGLDLSQTDLIRNFVLMGLKPDQQTRLYNEYWRPMEVAFGQKAYSEYFDDFMRHYLTFKSGEIPKLGQVYEAFKKYANNQKIAAEGIDALVADIRSFADYYCAMAFGKETSPLLDSVFRDSRELGVSVAYPFLLELYQDYSNGILSAKDLAKAVRLVESYVFRRVVCSIPTNSHTKTFATFSRALKKDRYLESICAHFLLMPSYRRFPEDKEFRRSLEKRDLYNFYSRSYWLRRMENHNHKEKIPVDEYSVEHILPQNSELSQPWKDALGDDWEQVQAQFLHTLGNLTLTGYNSELGDRPFLEKRDMEGGFKESPLRLNRGLGMLDTWNEAAIQDRARRLSQEATAVWIAPSLPTKVLQVYRPQAEPQPQARTIEDYVNLPAGSAMRTLFNRFRLEVQALNPCVSEEFCELVIAYRAETDFVEVVPQANQLRLSLHLPFHELHDPQKLAKDVKNLSRWSSGDVEISLSSLDELPYVLGLVRQAFDKQMGNEEVGS